MAEDDSTYEPKRGEVLPPLGSKVDAQLAEKLTDKQRQMVDAIVLHGRSKTDAIAEAGYENSSGGYKALRSPAVQEYMRKLVTDNFLLTAIDAARVQHELIQSAKSEYVRLEAAKDLLDRAGFKPVERHAHLHGGEVSIKIDLG